MTLVLVVRHGLTAATGTALVGRTPGIPLDDRGRAQALALAQRLSPVRLDAIVSSPLERCAQTAAAIAHSQELPGPGVQIDNRLIEVGYGDWTGQSLRKLSRDPLWRVVQAHPSAVTFPGPDGEPLQEIQRRAVAAVRDWNLKLGPEAVYLICSHADVIKAILADSLGLHLDMYQRIQVDPCSLSVIRYTPLRPFVERLNDTGGSVTTLIRTAHSQAVQQQSDKARAATPALRPGDAPVGGGAGG